FRFTAPLDLSASRTDQVIALPRIHLSATITDSAGTPVPDATIMGTQQLCSHPLVTLLGNPASGQFFSPGTARADPNGLASVPLYPCADPLPFRVTPPTDSGLGSRVVKITVTDDTTTTIVLPPGVEFSGWVRDRSGNPLATTRLVLVDS